MNNKTATVEVLTAEVRALMVGSRQITLSVFRQLDWVPWDECEPMGRVNDERDKEHLDIGFVIGKHKPSGVLCRARLKTPPKWTAADEDYIERTRHWGSDTDHFKSMEKKRDRYNKWWDDNSCKIVDFEALPLIVLAGLK